MVYPTSYQGDYEPAGFPMCALFEGNWWWAVREGKGADTLVLEKYENNQTLTIEVHENELESLI